MQSFFNGVLAEEIDLDGRFDAHVYVECTAV